MAGLHPWFHTSWVSANAYPICVSLVQWVHRGGRPIVMPPRPVTTALTPACCCCYCTSSFAGYAEGVKIASLSPHANAVTPACQHFGTCGGCSLQSLAYEAQLAHKMNHVAQLLTRVGKLEAAEVAAARCAPLPAQQQYGYRNKVQMAFSSLVWEPEKQQQGQLADHLEKQQQLPPPLQQQQKDHMQHQQQHLEQGTATAASQWSRVVPGVVSAGWGLGFLMPGSGDVVLPIQQCHLAVSRSRGLGSR